MEMGGHPVPSIIYTANCKWMGVLSESSLAIVIYLPMLKKLLFVHTFYFQHATRQAAFYYSGNIQMNNLPTEMPTFNFTEAAFVGCKDPWIHLIYKTFNQYS